MTEDDLYKVMRNAYIFSKEAPDFEGDPEVWNKALERLVNEVSANKDSIADLRKLIARMRTQIK